MFSIAYNAAHDERSFTATAHVRKKLYNEWHKAYHIKAPEATRTF